MTKAIENKKAALIAQLVLRIEMFTCPVLVLSVLLPSVPWPAPQFRLPIMSSRICSNDAVFQGLSSSRRAAEMDISGHQSAESAVGG